MMKHSSQKSPLFWLLISVAVSFTLGTLFAHKIAIPWTLRFLVGPVPSPPPLVTGLFELKLKLILVCGIALSIPVLVGFLWFSFWRWKKLVAWILTAVNIAVGVISYFALLDPASRATGLAWWAALSLLAGGPLAMFAAIVGFRSPRQWAIAAFNIPLVVGYLFFFWVPIPSQ
ncbi:MAG: hypothetical protein L0387_19305 [Acidobacteria bacterium]|nr:hypothetical protein [Acidobacteriota bacterium]